MYNKFKKGNKYLLEKFDDGTYELMKQKNDSPFSYHLYLKNELETAIKNGQVHKYHFNFLRNILEKTATFLGYSYWGDLLPDDNTGARQAYKTRIINFSSHFKHAAEEVAEFRDKDKKILGYLVQELNKSIPFKKSNEN